MLVSSIRRSGPSAQAKPALKSGDVILRVNGESIHCLADFQAITQKITENDQTGVNTMVEFERNTQLLATVVSVAKKANPSESSAAASAWMGVKTQVLTKDLATVSGLKGKKGVRLTQIIPGTRAAEAGLMKGDVLLKVDGTTISASKTTDKTVFETMLRDYDYDSTVELLLVRDGKEMKLEVPLQTAPPSASESEKVVVDTLEFTIRKLAKTKRKKPNKKMASTSTQSKHLDGHPWQDLLVATLFCR